MKLQEWQKKIFKKRVDKDGTEKMVLPVQSILYAFIFLLVVLFCVSLIWVYATPRIFGERGVMLRERIPYPLVYIAPGTVISYRDFSENVRAVKQFYQNQDFSELGLRVDFTTEEGKKRFLVRQKEALNKMIEDQAVIKLAKENNITITKEMARDGVRRSLDEYGTGDQVQNDLKRLYGWELTTFEERVVTPKLYQEKLEEVFANQEKPKEEAEMQINKAKEALDKGTAFSEVAKQFSQGNTKGDGGELGWFQISDLAPELQVVVPSQAVGTPSAIVESDLGFHIVLVEEVKKEDGKDLYRISQIFTKKKLFVDWLTEKMQAMHVFILSPDYRWNQTDARVEFKSESMRLYEDELYKNSQGDALFLF